jgi:hypothetical protein
MLTYPSSTYWGDYEFPEEVSGAQRALAESRAWHTIQALSGFSVAIAPTSVRPCRRRDRYGSYYVANELHQNSWVDAFCFLHGMYGGNCACGGTYAIVLPGPVGEVLGVEIDGEYVDPTAYRIDNGDVLVRQDGEVWPVWQDMQKRAGEENTFVVHYYQGFAPDEHLDYAAGLLAIEYIKAELQDDDCQLPSSVRSITRQGIQMDVVADLFSEGLTGIRAVDDIIGRYNPHRLKSPTLIASPDSLRHSRHTTIG